LREVGMSKILGNEWAPAFLHCGSKVVPTRFGTGCADLLRVCCLSSWICLNDSASRSVCTRFILGQAVPASRR
jgi:hypothetical protein